MYKRIRKEKFLGNDRRKRKEKWRKLPSTRAWSGGFPPSNLNLVRMIIEEEWSNSYAKCHFLLERKKTKRKKEKRNRRTLFLIRWTFSHALKQHFCSIEMFHAPIIYAYLLISVLCRYLNADETIDKSLRSETWLREKRKRRTR